MIKASDFPIHTEGFARDAVAAGGERALLDGVYFLAAAAARILTEPALLDRVRGGFPGQGRGRAGRDRLRPPVAMKSLARPSRGVRAASPS